MNKNIHHLIENILSDIDELQDTDQYDIDSQYLYKYIPQNRKELLHCIIYDHVNNGIYDLNDIDVSHITDFSDLFANINVKLVGMMDVSKWDVSHVTNFERAFFG